MQPQPGEPCHQVELGRVRQPGPYRREDDPIAADPDGSRTCSAPFRAGHAVLGRTRRGALVSGLDFSSPAIRAATSLAAAVGIDTSFVVSDVYDAAAAFGGNGSTPSTPARERWSSCPTSRAGGSLYLVEGHPFAQVLDDATGARAADFASTYTDGPGAADRVLARVRLRRMARFKALRRGPDGLRLPPGQTPMPMLYSLRASTPG